MTDPNRDRERAEPPDPNRDRKRAEQAAAEEKKPLSDGRGSEGGPLAHGRGSEGGPLSHGRGSAKKPLADGRGSDLTLAHPETVIQSINDPEARLYYRYYFGTRVGDKWLCVVVKFVGNEAFVVTAYLTNRRKQGEVLWPRNP